MRNKLGSWDPGSRGTFIKPTKLRNIQGDFPLKLQQMHLNLTIKYVNFGSEEHLTLFAGLDVLTIFDFQLDRDVDSESFS